MNQFLSLFVQFGIVNTLYDFLFGRPQKYGIRGLYIDDKAIMGNHNGLLVPKAADRDVNKFFHHSFLPHSHYDFVFIDGAQGYEASINKLYQSCRHLIPGGYIVMRNAGKACRSDPLKRKRRLIDDLKNNKNYDILEFPDGDGLAVIRVKENDKLKKANLKPKNAGFWIGIGILGGLVIGELYKGKQS